MRVAIRLAAIHEEMAVHPPPISLTLKNADTDLLVQSLSTELGVDFKRVTEGGFAQSNRYSVSMHEKPFWDVFVALSRQHPLVISPEWDEGWACPLMETTRFQMLTPVGAGPVVVFPQSLRYERGLQVQNDSDKPQKYQDMFLDFLLAADPRMQIVGMTIPELIEVRDEDGHVLFQRKSAAPGEPTGAPSFSHDRRRTAYASIRLPPPPAMGTKLTAKGEWMLKVQSAERTMVVEQIGAAKTPPVEGSGMRLVFESIGPVENHWQDIPMLFERIAAENEPGEADAPVSEEIADVRIALAVMRIFDADGIEIWKDTLDVGRTSARVYEGHKIPLKAVVTIPTKVTRVTVPFEMRDLPIPK